ncbi:MAG: radical SAM protein [bacterium]
MGLALLKSYLAKKGLKARVFDLNILLYNVRHGPYSSAWDSKICPHILTAKWPSESFVRQMYAFYSHEVLNFMYSVLAAKPRTIGFSVHRTSFIAARMLASKFKQIAPPKTRIIFGGPEVARYTHQWKDLLASGHADAVLFGEGEESLTQYLKANQAGAISGVASREPDGNIVDGGPRPSIPSLNDLPYADFSDFELAAYANKNMLTTYFSRGCVNRCIFCTENQFFPKFRCRSGRRVFDDVVHQISLHPETNYFDISDSVSNGNIRELETFCDLVIESGVKINFSLFNAVIRKEMDLKLYGKLKRAGCVMINYGLETPSKSLLKSVGKTVCLDADFDKVISEGTHSKLIIGVNMMFGLPGETPDDHEQQLAFLHRHRHERKQLILVGCSPCRFPAGCTVHQNPSGYGVELGEKESWWSKTDGSSTFIDRLAKVENFCAEAGRLGYRDPLDNMEADRDYLLADYYQHKGEKKQAFHCLRKALNSLSPPPSPPGEEGGDGYWNITAELADRIMSLYADLSLEKDGYYNELLRFKTEKTGDEQSDFENMLSKADMVQYILSSSFSEMLSRLDRFIGEQRPPVLRLSLTCLRECLMHVRSTGNGIRDTRRHRMLVQLLKEADNKFDALRSITLETQEKSVSTKCLHG